MQVFCRVRSRAFRESKSNCPCRDKTPEKNLEDWSKMLDGTLQARGRSHPCQNGYDAEKPSITRLACSSNARYHSKSSSIDQPLHRRTKYGHSFDFQSAVKDHLRVLHIIRVKRLMDSSRKQTLLYEHFGWTYPETILRLQSKVHRMGSRRRRCRASIKNEYEGWDDPRLPTIQGLQARGIQANALQTFGLNWSA